MTTEDEEHGLSTPQKVVAGAALGMAIPAVAVVAKRLLGTGENAEEGQSPEGSARESGEQETGAGGGSPTGTGRTPRAGSRSATEKQREKRTQGSAASRGTTSKSGGA